MNNMFSDPSFLDYALSNKMLALIKDRDICEMTNFENCFLFSLIKEKQPKKILEIGISGGATTLMMLNYISSYSPDTQLYSIDLAEKWYRDTTKKSGFLASEQFENFKNWKLFLGKIYPECCEEIGNDIDFCIIDTNHSLPGELLDFIAVLPNLKDNAVVVLHDTNLQLRKHNSPKIGDQMGYATKMVLDVAKGEKIICKIDNDDSNYNLPNISAIIVNNETRKNIRDLFSALSFRWNYILPLEHINSYADNFKKYYSEDYEIYFKNLINSQRVLISSFKSHVLKTESNINLIKIINDIDEIKNHITRYPKWFVNIICLFIPFKNKRHKIRKKYSRNI